MISYVAIDWVWMLSYQNIAIEIRNKINQLKW